MSTNVTSGMLNALQKRTNPAPLSEASISSAPGQHLRLVGHDAHRRPANPPEAHHQVARELGLHFQKIGAVHNQRNHVAHVIPGLGLDAARRR